jgi:hypothetical protein
MLVIVVALFALLALDFAVNDAGLFWAANAYVDEVMRQIRLI